MSGPWQRARTRARDLLFALVKGQTLRRSAVLALRIVAARGLSVVTLLAAAWFFSVEAFALFGVFVALASVLIVVLFLRYDNALIGAADDEEAAKVLRLCGVIGCAVLALVAGVAALAVAQGLVPAVLASLFVPALAARGLLRLSLQLSTREGDLVGIGRVVLVQALVQPLALLALGAWGGLDNVVSLALSDLLGHAAAALYLARRRAAWAGRAGQGVWRTSDLTALARHWSAQPLSNLPASLLANLFAAAPLLVMPMVADATTAGHVALATRLFDAIARIFVASTGPVLLHAMTASAAGLALGRRLVARIAAGVAVLFGGLCLAILAAGPWLAGTIFAGLPAVAPWVAGFQAGVALAGLLSEVVGIGRRQRALALVNLVAVGSLAPVLAAGQDFGVVPALALFLLVSVMRAGIVGEIVRALVLARRAAAPSA